MLKYISLTLSLSDLRAIYFFYHSFACICVEKMTRNEWIYEQKILVLYWRLLFIICCKFNKYIFCFHPFFYISIDGSFRIWVISFTYQTYSLYVSCLYFMQITIASYTHKEVYWYKNINSLILLNLLFAIF